MNYDDTLDHSKYDSYRILQQQVVVDTDHVPASVGIPADRNQIHPPAIPTNRMQSAFSGNDEAILNDMTQLNNELVNTQRLLVKQNDEITKLNKELNAVNADLKLFTHVASHDLKEPIRMVTGFMGLIKTTYGPSLDKKANSYIDFALDGGMRMERMITDLLELTHIARNLHQKEMADMNLLLDDAIQNVSTLVAETAARIDITTPLPVLPVYKSSISRLFQNLLSNAIKFRKEDQLPVICVSAAEGDKEWTFYIRDNGIGIPKENFENIFELFSRLHTEEKIDGTGIGLSVCKKAAENHGGRIWVDSEEGIFTQFSFTIPKPALPKNQSRTER